MPTSNSTYLVYLSYMYLFDVQMLIENWTEALGSFFFEI